MSQTTDVPPPAGDQPPSPPPPTPPPHQGPSAGGATYDRVSSQVRALRRSRSERVIAGVCGGVARNLGLDPVFVRVLFAVLAVIGGAGIVLYAFGWLLLAEDDGRPSVAERAITRTSQPGAGRPILLAVVLTVVALAAVADLSDNWDGWVLLVLVVTGLVLWIDRRGDVGPVTATGPNAPPYAAAQGFAATPPPPAPATATWTSAPGGTTAPTVGAPEAPTATGATAYDATTAVASTGYQLPAAPPTGYGPTSYGPTGYGPTSYGPTGYGPPGYTAPAPVPPGPPEPRRPRSVLLAGTLSCALLGVGALAAVEASGTDIPDAAYPALLLAVVGAGLVLGAWFGRSRGLIAIGVVLALATGAAAGSDRIGDMDRRGVDAVLRPLTVADLPGSADYGVGEVTYDLSAVDFTAGAGLPVRLALSMGVGDMLVIVPPDVDVTVDANAGVGDLNLLGRSDGGLGNATTVTDLGADGPGGGTLALDLSMGIGEVEVRRG